jgi:chaperonin GroES
MANPLIFKPTTLQPGDRVIIGHYSDWESWFSDYEGRGRNVVLCQEADVRLFQRGKNMPFTPIYDRVLVRRKEEAAKTPGGLFIPDAGKDKPQEGYVISVGPGSVDDKGEVFPVNVKAGDCILFGKHAGTEIKLDGEDLLILREADLLGRVN